ncbi:hypothetical protein AMTR_s00109p00125940 [Amborella trichopoda]|uniref:TIR domain-containing protein n=1 Tax=Amborella trichopoda TaxID=13333 RepID=W1NSM9_AMBTC|nr:hypothetical protein AMTR_s00109p00125940 [Amborella trichopoda]
MAVFLNFCDEDTGKSFTAHLNKSLTDSGISTTFSLTQQKPPPPPRDIEKAIKECEVFIAVFSPNYASSFSCLHHLSYVLSLPTRRTIVPVFYEVEPWHVCWQKGPFEGAFEDHKNKNTMQGWRNALKEVAHIFGLDTKDYSYASSSFCLDKLFYILSLPPTRRRPFLPATYDMEPSDFRWQKGSFKGAFEDHKRKNGIDEETMQRSRNALKEVADLSGWEMKNYGAEANLVEKLVTYVSTNLESKAPMHIADHPVGLESRIADVMGLLDIDNVDARIIGIHGMGGIGINVIKNRIGSKKVVVVIDDIDSEKQLENLAINRGGYHKGSRIIITTRDEHVLNVNKRVDECHIYKLKELDGTESLQLFCRSAFGMDEPKQEYANLSEDVVSNVGGLPLALEVLGSYLNDKTLEEWEEAVKNLKPISEKDVMPTLKISFDDLNEETKQMFLDIACFFIGEDRDYTIDIWKGCGFPVLNSIRKLLQRTLKKIINKNGLWMHDLLRDMGRRIVELENLDDPGRRSRLWSEEVINDGTRKVRGINVLDTIETEAFKSLTNLKLLRINGVSLNGSFKISFIGISVDTMLFPKLKSLHLNNCYNLERIPDCSLYPNLEKLMLAECPNLEELPDSLGSLANLKELDVTGCYNLSRYPASIGRMRSLRYLRMGIISIAALPDDFGHLSNLEELNMEWCEQLKELPKSFRSLTSLRILKIREINLIPSFFSGFSSLEELEAEFCNLEGMIPDGFEKLSSLKTLSLGNNNFQGLPSSMRGLSQLETLSVKYCKQLVAIPELPTSLKVLDAPGCKSLQTIPKLSHLSKLENLNISCCEKLLAIEDLPTILEILNANSCISLQVIPNLAHFSKL